MKQLRIATVGSGAMGRTHAFAVSALPYCYRNLPFDAVLDTLVTRSADTGAQKAKELGFLSFSTSLDEVLRRDDIDIIDICTPNSCHYDEVKKAISAHKHVLCEKPLAISVSEASELTALAKKSDCICGMSFNNRHLPAVIRAKMLVNEGKIGDIISFRVVYRHASSVNPHTIKWKQDKNICGGGVLFDLGSHAIDLLHYVLGDNEKNRIHKVYGSSQIFFKERIKADGGIWHTNADEAFYMTATLASGATGTIEVSKLHVGTNDDFTLEIFGTLGALKFDLMQPSFLSFYDATADKTNYGGLSGFTSIECVGRYANLPCGITAVFPSGSAPVGWERGHIHSILCFLCAVYTGTHCRPDFADGLYVQQVMESAYESAEKDIPVYIKE